MVKFCVRCGAPLGSGPSCVKCGADTRNLAGSAQPQSTEPRAQASPQSPPLASPAPAKQGVSALAKLGIAAVAIIFVGGVAAAVGVFYAARRATKTVHQAEERILRSSPADRGDRITPGDSSFSKASSGASGSDVGMGDVCRFLSKEDIGQAIGVEIVRTKSEDNGCNYFAKGTQADMTAKHAGAMMASRGVDPKTQQTIENISGGMFKAFAEQNHQPDPNSSGEVMVFNFSVDQHAAESQMRLNAEGMSTIGDSQGIPGIGDQAFSSSDGLMMVRKGRSLIRIWYLTCPCGIEAVKPLAKKIAGAL